MKKIFIILMFFCFFVTSLFANDLRITEVFVDGTDERVEIANIGSTDFIGSFQLSGVKSSLLSVGTITLAPMNTLLIGDNLSMLSLGNSLNILGGRGLSLGDTSPVSISLLYDNQEIDRFDVDQSTVQSYDNTMTSFQKLYNGGGFDILATLSPFSIGVNSPTLANPGKVYKTDGSIRLPTTSSGTGSGDSGEVMSGGILTGSESSGFMIDCTTAWSGVLMVDEIHFGTTYTPYIELLFLQDRNGSLGFSGTALSGGFILPSHSYKANTRYLIAQSSSGLIHTDNIIIQPLLHISLGTFSISPDTAGGSYYAQVDNIGSSVYISSPISCVDQISSVANPSPGFDRQFLGYLNTSTVTTTVIQPLTGSCTTGGTIPGSGFLTGSQQTGGNFLSGMYSFHDVRISLIEYDPPGSDTNTERIGLRLMTGSSVELSGWSLAYDGKSYKFVSGSLLSGIDYIRVANFGLVNSRSVCVSLLYLGMIIDTSCYDPTIHTSPYTPLSVSGSSSTGNNFSGGDESFDYGDLQFDIISLVYDPDGSDTDRETVTIQFIGGTTGIDLSLFRLRVGTTSKRIYGMLHSGQTLTLMGNFQMPNTKATCVALSYNDIVYDEYCYNPISISSPGTVISNTTNDTMMYNNHRISILHINYDPEGSDTDRETVTLLITGNQSSVDLSKLYLRLGTTKRYLNSILYSDYETVVTGNFQLPNSKNTCVDLMEGTYIFDTYCYDPGQEDSIVVLTGEIHTGTKNPLTQTIDWESYYSGIQLQRILPNPKDKDIKNLNEKIGVLWPGGSGQILTKHIKLTVGKTSLSLSGYMFIADESTIVASKSLTNQPACVKLIVEGKVIDQLCYPQAKEGQIYYHPRIEQGPETIPLSLIQSLDRQGIDLSDLKLKKIGKQICLTYDDISVRCMNAGSSSTSAKNKALLTLGNNYIRKMSELLYDKNMDYTTMEQWRKGYRTLSLAIKDGNIGDIVLYGEPIKVTDLDSYITRVYQMDQEQYLTDQFSRILFGHQAVDEYYEDLY